MTNRRVVYRASLAGTHPSYATSGVYVVDCDECGDEITYTANIAGTYYYHDEPVGEGTDGDLCAACWEDIEGSPLA